MSPLIRFDDSLDFTRLVQDGRTLREYPFLTNGDFSTVVYRRSLLVREAAYIPPVPGTERDSVWPGGDPLAWNLPDSPPVWAGIADLVRIERAYARIPPTQYEPASVSNFARPLLHDLKVTVSATDYYAVSFDDRRSWIFSTGRKSVSSVGAITGGTSVAVAAEAFGTLNSDTFSIDDGGGAVSPSMNAGAATIQASLESNLTLLTSVSVSSTPDSLTISWTGTIVSVSTTSTNVTMEGGAGTDGSVTFRAKKPSVTDTQTAAGPKRTITTGSSHSGASGDHLVCWNGDKIVAITKAIAAAGSSVTVPADKGPLAVTDIAITHVGFAAGAQYCVPTGPCDCSARIVRRFYMPGVTAGVASAADIPAQTVVTSDPVSWFTAIVPQLSTPSASNYAVHSIDNLDRWLGGAILEKAAVEIQLQDAVTSLSVSV